ncbi:MAG: protein phosphatase 2C domain-containing protein [Chloroflexi bacterium]|nr:protein phosphatase 2C domain-containing protein [Chloroflexota bacterium]MBP8058210.1 protein phosphatase 2C domain-containing protein [Chloroflexota bacterium]
MEAIEKIEELLIGHGTHEGMSGKHNEDSYGFFAWNNGDGVPLYIGVVADGVGGQTAGEVASSLAVEAIQNYFRQQKQINGNINGHLERAILAANKAVYEYSQSHREVSGMGTTMVLVAIFEQNLYTAYVGDSRIYLFRNGQLRQITVDHTWAQEAIQVGLLTKEQAKTHPNRNVIKRFLGGFPEVEVDHRLVLDREHIGDDTKKNQGHPLQPGDIVLLCSDGLSDMIEDDIIENSIQVYQSQLQSAAHDLINKANQGGGRDNITALLLQVPGKPKASLLTTGRLPKMPTATLPVYTAPVAAAIPATPTPPRPINQPPVVEQNRRTRWPWIFLGLAAILFLVVMIVIAVTGLGLLNNYSEVATPDAVDAVETVSGQTPIPEGIQHQEAATVPIINLTQTGQDNVATPEIIATDAAVEPTIAAIPTNTNTPTRRIPTATATAMPTLTLPYTVTAQPTTDGGGGGGGGGIPPTASPEPPILPDSRETVIP